MTVVAILGERPLLARGCRLQCPLKLTALWDGPVEGPLTIAPSKREGQEPAPPSTRLFTTSVYHV
jgi:hypothetical protein